MVAGALSSAPEPGPLFDVDRGALSEWVEQDAAALSKKWGRWAQAIELKRDALRPPRWIVSRNPSFRERAAHKGDLRCSVLETLRRDLGNGPVSEADLSRRCAATVVAIRAALDDLERELPGLEIERCRGRSGTRIRLKPAKFNLY